MLPTSAGVLRITFLYVPIIIIYKGYYKNQFVQLQFKISTKGLYSFKEGCVDRNSVECVHCGVSDRRTYIVV